MPGPSIYRLNVAAIVAAPDGRILICERAGMPGAWQFPQGGVHEGEALEAALARELGEELSLSPENFMVREKRGPYRYLFEPGRTKEGFQGQEQFYFRVELGCPAELINIDTAEPEFQALRWIVPHEFSLGWLPEMKRAVHKEVFRDFFGVSLSAAMPL